MRASQTFWVPFIAVACILATGFLLGGCSSSNDVTGGGSPAPSHDAGATAPTGGGAADGGDAGPGTTDDGGGSVVPEAGVGGGDAALPYSVSYVSGVMVGTLAGSAVAGTQDGTGAAAQFDNPTGLALDSNGNLVEADYDSARIRLITPGGVVTTLAYAANFVDPFSVVVANGKYYVGTDADNTGTKTATSGTVWLVAPVAGSIVTPTFVAAGFDRPRGLGVMSGALLVVDRDLDVVDTLSESGGQSSVLAGSSGVTGFANGSGTAAQFSNPVGGAALPDGSFVVADSSNNVIRHVTSAGAVTTLAGNGAPTLVDGPCASASFNDPRAVAADSLGNVYVSDLGNQAIRMITASCNVQTLAGGGGAAGFADGYGNQAQFYGQEGIAVASDGGVVYVADGNGGDGSAHNRIRTVTVP